MLPFYIAKICFFFELTKFIFIFLMKMVVMEYVKMLALEVMMEDVMVMIEIMIEGEAGRSRPWLC